MFSQIGVLNIAPVWKPCHKGNLPSNHRVLGASSSFQGESYFLEFNLGQNFGFMSFKLKISILIIRTNIALKMVVGKLLSFWRTLFSDAMLVQLALSSG